MPLRLAPMMYLQHPARQLIVAVSGCVVETISEYEQRRRNDSEAGGVLIGERRQGSITITAATRPQPTDSRGRYHFRRKAKGHQEAVTAAWNASEGVSHYLGEWHTHPEAHPSPSLTDRLGWISRSIASKHALVVVIWGQGSSYFALQEGARLTPLLQAN